MRAAWLACGLLPICLFVYAGQSGDSVAPLSPDARVEYEVERASVLIQSAGGAIHQSPYLVSAVFYSHGLYGDSSDDLPDASPARRILGRLARMITPDVRRRLIDGLTRDYGSVPAAFVPPLEQFDLGRGSIRRVHPRAIDMFAKEGSPVRSASNGIVMLAEGGWTPDDSLSTTSSAGGNTIIIFDPPARRFFRYGHLDSVLATPGTRVAAGAIIGTVGHTGSANRAGHGDHLHFEINEYNDGRTRGVDHSELRQLVKPYATPLAPVRRSAAIRRPPAR